MLQLQTMGGAIDTSPQQYFNEVLPKIIEAQREPCAKLGGTYGIKLFGEKGGAWTLDFPAAAVRPEVDAKVDFYLEMTAVDFIGMMKGSLDVEKAALAGKIRFEGDPRYFTNLAIVLKPADD